LSNENPLNRDKLLECLRHVVRLRRAQMEYAIGLDPLGARKANILSVIVDQQLKSLVDAGLMNPELPIPTPQENAS
jgi:hypothetical protein